MTRKRYIKLLMACGVSRKCAAWATRCVQASRVSYREDLACSLGSLRAGVLPVSAEELCRRIEILLRALYGEVAHE